MSAWIRSNTDVCMDGVLMLEDIWHEVGDQGRTGRIVGLVNAMSHSRTSTFKGFWYLIDNCGIKDMRLHYYIGGKEAAYYDNYGIYLDGKAQYRFVADKTSLYCEAKASVKASGIMVDSFSGCVIQNGYKTVDGYNSVSASRVTVGVESTCSLKINGESSTETFLAKFPNSFHAMTESEGTNASLPCGTYDDGTVIPSKLASTDIWMTDYPVWQ